MNKVQQFIESTALEIAQDQLFPRDIDFFISDCVVLGLPHVFATEDSDADLTPRQWALARHIAEIIVETAHDMCAEMDAYAASREADYQWWRRQ